MPEENEEEDERHDQDQRAKHLNAMEKSRTIHDVNNRARKSARQI